MNAPLIQVLLLCLAAIGLFTVLRLICKWLPRALIVILLMVFVGVVAYAIGAADLVPWVHTRMQGLNVVSLGINPPTSANPSVLATPLSLPVEISGITFMQMPSGAFVMGSPADEPGHRPDQERRDVVISNPFNISATEITQAQYAALTPSAAVLVGSPELPMTKISFEEAVQFCWRLQAGNPQWRFRLPTEAEWGFACRAGFAGPFPPSIQGRTDFQEALHKYQAGDVDFLRRKVRHVAWFNEFEIKPVGTLEPNAFGLYDMLGNVWEWTETFDLSPPSSDLRPIRGGAWCSTDLLQCRAASRAWENRDSRKDSIGFRVVCVPR
jgi:formylglycine-generating enzyme required for sulfatase activity